MFDLGGAGPQLFDHEAERALLGSLMTNNATFAKVAELITADDFSEPAHGRIYEAIATLINRGEQANATRLRLHAGDDEEIVRVGGAAYILRLVGEVVTVVNAPDYALTIRDLAMRRRLIQACDQIKEAAKIGDIDVNPFDIHDRAQALLLDIGAGAVRAQGPRNAADFMGSTVRRIEGAYKGAGVGRPTGIVAIDQMIGGLEDGTLLILAARPSMGKTGLALEIGKRVARAERPQGGPVAFFSLEMSADQLGQRMIATELGLSLQAIRTGQLTAAQMVDVVRCGKALEDLPIHIDDTPAPTVAKMLLRARQMKARHGLALAVVDHMQLVAGASTRGNMTEIMTEISAGLKAMAKILNVPVIALSQLSRQLEGRDDKRPTLSDLRSSGSIEQDADVVMFLYREAYYLARSTPQKRGNETPDHHSQRVMEHDTRSTAAAGIAEVIVDKQRQGPTGKAVLRYEAECVRFSDMGDNVGPELF